MNTAFSSRAARLDALPEWALWLRLSQTPSVGPQTLRQLLQAFGSVQAVLAQSPQALQQVLSHAQVQALQREPPDWLALCTRTQAWLSQAAEGVQHAVWTWGDAQYPPGLLALDDPPPLLFAQGQLERPCNNSVAIVGSRNPTAQGRDNARAFAHSLQTAGCCVVSGLALGIDGAAHQGALQAANRFTCATIAVVGTGLDQVYPRAHQGLARQVAQHGWLLSELPPGTPAVAHHFPRRNRLIAGLSSGVLVVEAALKSGSLITADMALSQGKEVFAVPGSIHSALSRGCHALLRQGAKLVETAQDVLEELPLQLQVDTDDAPSAHAQPQGAIQHALCAALGHDPQSLDVLLVRSQLALEDALVALHEMESNGVLARLPGGLYQRIGA
jgi:DNA processing protein